MPEGRLARTRALYVDKPGTEPENLAYPDAFAITMALLESGPYTLNRPGRVWTGGDNPACPHPETLEFFDPCVNESRAHCKLCGAVKRTPSY